MNSERAKIQKIMDEMFIYTHQMDAKKVTINYEETDEEYIIDIISDFNPMKVDMLYTLNRYLSVARQEEMEGYYWELTGNYSDDSALSIVGMMTDEVDISYDEDNMMEIRLIRKKN